MPKIMPEKKIALITGGGSGIGLATAKAMVEAGFIVVVTGRRIDTLKEAIAPFPEGHAFAIPADITDPHSVNALFAEIEKKFGRIDILFNNAGLNIKAASVEEITYQDWQKVINTNLTGSFLCLQAAVKLMKKQIPRGGRIINNGSVSAEVPRYFAAPYTAAKHAITGLTKSTSLDCREFDIACCQIDIGNAATSLTTRMNTGALQADGSLRPEPTIDTKNIADTVCHMANLPLDANAMFITLLATKMPFVGRG